VKSALHDLLNAFERDPLALLDRKRMVCRLQFDRRPRVSADVHLRLQDCRVWIPLDAIANPTEERSCGDIFLIGRPRRLEALIA